VKCLLLCDVLAMYGTRKYAVLFALLLVLAVCAMDVEGWIYKARDDIDKVRTLGC